MKRKLLSLLIGGLAVSAAHADNMPTIYGKADVTLNQFKYDRAATSTSSYNAQDNWQLQSNASRLGVKGDYPVTGDTKVIYKLEYEIFVDGSSSTSGSQGGSSYNTFTQRNTYAGLQGGWGTFFAGKNDTPLKAIAADTVQLFKDLPLADFRYIMVGENRENNILQYATPNLSGFVFSLQVEPGEDSGSNDKAGTTQTKNTNHNIVDKYSTAITYKLDKLYLALAYDDNEQNSNTVRFVGQYTIGPVTFGGLAQNSDRNYKTVPDTAGTTLVAAGLTPLSKLPNANNNSAFNPINDFASNYQSQDAYVLSAAWKIDDFTIKGQYGYSSSEPVTSTLSDTKAKNYVLGVDYKLTDASKVFAYYAEIETDGNNAKYDGTLKDKTFAVGYDFKF